MIGIIGGVGPFAGLSLHQAILKFSDAGKDQDHLPVIHINAASEIPDRTEYLLGQVETNPNEALIKQAGKLIDAGAVYIGIPCNTAHHPSIFDAVQAYCAERGAVLVNMIKETIKSLGDSKVGLLATQGTYSTKIYQHYNKEFNADIVVPEKELQGEVHSMIYKPGQGLKSTGTFNEYSKGQLEKSLVWSDGNGIDKLILGCTELGVFVPVEQYEKYTFVNTIEVLAKTLIDKYNNSNR
jgi:aspartate racemase